MNYSVVLSSIFALHVLAMISPGPNVLVVAQTAISRTRRAGIFISLGIATGAAVWSSAALLGLNLLFTQFPWFYSGLKVMGGIYLLYIGAKMWRAADHPLIPSRGLCLSAQTDWQAFRLGLLTNLTNPKAAIFYGSIFAALLKPDFPVWVKLTAIGIIVFNAVWWHISLAYLFSTQYTRQVYQRIKRWIDRIAGTALAFFGLLLIHVNR